MCTVQFYIKFSHFLFATVLLIGSGRFSKRGNHQHPWFRKSTITIDAAKKKKYKKEKYSEQSATMILLLVRFLLIPLLFCP